MHSILHRVTIETSPEAVYQSLVEERSLSKWWTKATASGKVGSTNCFFFGADGSHQVDMEVCELKLNELIVWKCIRGPWQATGKFAFSITPDERGAVLHFSHQGWAETDDFYQHCNTKWGFFLGISLKNYLENGTGQPHPQDPSI
ncbi:MAG: hypothetical protein ACI8P9_004738 [Parasphingorhabdus sp.]|jgi:uncharacterized protein YndB with AHSA1/START domain